MRTIIATLVLSFLVSTTAFAAVDKDEDGFAADATNAAEKDCNDDPTAGGGKVYPGATEIPGDGIDQDCDGKDAAGAPVTCPTGQTAGCVPAKAEKTPIVVDDEARKCVTVRPVVDGRRFDAVQHATNRAHCQDSDKGCVWHGPDDADPNLRCWAKTADGYGHVYGAVVDSQAALLDTQARIRAAQASAEAARAALRAEVARRAADIKRLTTEIAEVRTLAAAAATQDQLKEVEAKAEAAQEMAAGLGVLLVGGTSEDGEEVPGLISDFSAMRLEVYGDGTHQHPGILSRLTAVEGTVRTHTTQITALEDRAAPYFFVGARVAMMGQTPITLTFPSEGDSTFRRAARRSFAGGGGVEVAFGVDLPSARVGLLLQVDGLAEQGDLPSGDSHWFTGANPAVGVEALAKTQTPGVRVGGAVSWNYHPTAPSTLGMSRAVENGVRLQGRIVGSFGGEGATGFTLTASPYVNLGGCGATGVGTDGYVQSVTGFCASGGIAFALGFGN